MRELSTTIQTTIDSDDERKRTRARIFYYREARETIEKIQFLYTFSTRKRDGEKDAYPTTATERCQSAEEPAAASVGG